MKSATDIAADFHAGIATARTHVEEALARIDALNGPLNAFTYIRRDQALAEADAVDQRRARGEDCGPLAGVPVAVKEVYDVAGDVTTLGGVGNSRPAVADCEVVRRLRAAGAVIVGRTHQPEFGQFPMGDSRRYGSSRNPWDPRRSPGGSSSGSAIAVATAMVPIALGSDGGGSVRIPASACGIFGLKPTRGRVSSAPLAEHWCGLAGFGPLTRSVADLALVMEVISGSHPVDRFPMEAPPPGFFRDEAGARPLKILRALNPVMPGARENPEIRAAMEECAALLGAAGHNVRSASVRWPNPSAPFVTLFFAGMAIESGQVDHPERLEAGTRYSAAIGRRLPSGVVRQARATSEKIRVQLDEAFTSADLLMLPTLLAPPLMVEPYNSWGWMRKMLRSTPVISQTALCNVSGHPAISIPVGLDSHGLPVGVQLIARWGREDLLLQVARDCEKYGMAGSLHPPGY
ncbi:MAG: amidase family protein [Actinomycetaceae bacterium]|nr:amidase family protein [Actinomycetaceae bacterium]